MAQRMTGRDSAPVARSNDPISIFAKEEKKKHMTRKAAAATPTPEPTPVVETPVVETPTVAADDLAYLKAQRKAIAEQIKAAKEAKAAAKAAQPAKPAQPKVGPLEAVLARQAENTRKWLPETLAARVQARVKAGQEQAEALDAVMAQTRGWVEAILDAPTPATEPAE